MTYLGFFVIVLAVFSNWYTYSAPFGQGDSGKHLRGRPPLSPNHGPRELVRVGIGFGPRICSPKIVFSSSVDERVNLLAESPATTVSSVSLGSSCSSETEEECEPSVLAVVPCSMPHPLPVFDTTDVDDDEPTRESIEKNFNQILKLPCFFSLTQRRLYVGDIFSLATICHGRHVGSAEVLGSRLFEECNGLRRHLLGVPKKLRLLKSYHPYYLLGSFLERVRAFPSIGPYVDIKKILEALLIGLLNQEASLNHKRSFLLTATVQLRNAYRQLKTEQIFALSLTSPAKPLWKILSIAESFELVRDVMATAYAYILTELFLCGYGIADMDMLFFLPMFYLVVASVAFVIPYSRELSAEEQVFVQQAFSPLCYRYRFATVYTRCLMDMGVAFSIPVRSLRSA